MLANRPQDAGAPTADQGCRRSKSIVIQEKVMKKLYPVAIALCLFTFTSIIFAREAKLVRYPSYSNGRVAFTYLGDIWTADENGQNVQRLTVNKASDAFPRFSPDGKWIAFSSDRNGNLDV